MSDLVEKIQTLSREEALEAAGYVCDALGIDLDKTGAERTALESLTAQPFQSIQEIEQLARLVLMTAALTPEHEDAVRKAIEGSGQKQFILGGAEIVMLGALALGTLHIMVSKGKEREEETISIKKVGDETTTTICKTVQYGITGKLAGILGSYFGGAG
jgi:hypothetical protein